MLDLLERLKSALADRYALDSEIGRGGMAVVFLAEDLRHHRQVAIKVLHPELTATLGAERFLQEIEIVAGLQHPHILPLYDSGEAEGLLYYVMPYAEGESLRQRLDREGQLAVDESVRITVEVADGLNYAHRKGVVHRDIKPGNILLAEGHATIADFGIARAVEAARQEKITRTGLGVGTPLYASPEQATAQETLDGRTDIYSLGCVLYEMLAGEPPLTGATPQMIQARRLTETPTALHTLRDTVPPALDHVIARALARVPADRYATASQFGQALQAVLFAATPAPMADLAATPGALSMTATAVAPGPRKPRAAWLVAVVVVVGTAAGAWFVGQQAAAPETGSGPEAPAANAKREVQLTHDGDVYRADISPDGEWVAYCRGLLDPGPDRLMLVQVSDPTAPRGLARVDDCYQIRWLPDGTGVVFSGSVQGRMGTYLVTRYDSAPRMIPCGSWMSFAVSPDGKRCVGTETRGGRRVFVGPLDGSSPMDTLTLTGDYDWVGAVDWLPSGDRLAVETGVGSPFSSTVWTIDPDGSNQEEVLTITGSFSWRWSADGSALYYRLGTSDLMRLPVTTEGTPAGEAEWVMENGPLSRSLNGQRGVTERSARRSWIVRVSPDPELGAPASIVTPVRDWMEDSSIPAVSHDGEWISYWSTDGLFKLSVAGGSPVRLATSRYWHSWSPDDRYLVYAAAWQDTSRLWITRADRLHAPGMIEDEVAGLLLDPEWLGSRIYASNADATNTRVLDSLQVWSTERQAWASIDSVPVREADLQRGVRAAGRWLGSNDSVGTALLAVSPDGSRLLVYLGTRDGSRADSTVSSGFWLLSLDGSEQTRLPPMEGATIGWSDEGLYMFEPDPPALYLQRLDGSERRLLLELPEAVDYCRFRPATAEPELICLQQESQSDAWLIENFDPHVN